MDGSIERIAAYAVQLGYSSLTANVVHEAKRRLIDSLGCGLGAFDAEPCQIARRLASRSSIENGARIVGTGHRTLPELAAFANAVMVRYLDGNDTFPGGGGHPSDVVAPLLAVAEAMRCDGKALITAITLAYEVYYAIYRGALVRDRGIDHVFYATIGSAVGAGKLLGLDATQMGHAVALAVTPNIPLHATRRGDLSMWKGVAAGNAVRNGVFAALLAAEGMTGPYNAIEGSHGLAELLGQQCKLGPLAELGSETFKVMQSSFKYFLSEQHSQNPIMLALQLSREVNVDDIESVTIHTYWFAWHEIGSEPEKWHPTTRESADHSLPFIVSAVLIDGAFSDEIFSEARIRDHRVHALADKVSVKEDPEFTRRSSAELPCRIDIRTRGGELKSASAAFPRGHLKNPLTDDEVASKFRTLAGRFLPRAKVDIALQLLWKIDEVQDVAEVLDAFVVD